MTHDSDDHGDTREALELARMRAQLEDLLDEHDRQDERFGANALAAVGELTAAIGSPAALAACLTTSLRRWAGPHGGVGDVAPWWPTVLPDDAPPKLLCAALAAVDRVGAGLHEVVAAAVRGALLLRLGANAVALPHLAAAAASVDCAPEALVDRIVAAARAGDRAQAQRALASLRARAQAATHAASLRWRRCLQLATAVLGPRRPLTPRRFVSA